MYGNNFSQPYNPWQYNPYQQQPQQYTRYATADELEELRRCYDRLSQQIAAIRQGSGYQNPDVQGYGAGQAPPATGGGGWQNNPDAAGQRTPSGIQQPPKVV